MTAEEEQGIAWWMKSIPATGDDLEIWRLEGALAELRDARDFEAGTNEQRAEVQWTIDALTSRWQRVVDEVRA